MLVVVSVVVTGTRLAVIVRIKWGLSLETHCTHFLVFPCISERLEI